MISSKARFETLVKFASGNIVTAFMDGVEKFKILNAPTPLTQVTQEQATVHVLLMVKKTGKF